MRRTWLCAAAVTLAVMVVFAPRPWGGSGPHDSGSHGSALVGRVLAASFDAADLRVKDLRKPVRDLAPLSWVGSVVGLLLASIGRRAYAVVGPVARYRLIAAVAAHGSRAPPPVLI